MGLNFRTIGKLGFLLVIIGFFMPIACNMNGFQLAETFMKSESAFNGILLYVLFISAIAGLIIGALLVMKKNVPIKADWIVLSVCIVCGLIVYFRALSGQGISLQSGAYFILIGWIGILGAQIISKMKNET